MSHECVEATAGNTCSNCGRTFKVKELILKSTKGILVCLDHCWRRLAPTEKPKAKKLTTTIKREPVYARNPVMPDHSDIIKRDIEEMARQARKEEL